MDQSEQYRKLVESGTSPEEAAAAVDAEAMSFEEWQEIHGRSEIEAMDRDLADLRSGRSQFRVNWNSEDEYRSEREQFRPRRSWEELW